MSNAVRTLETERLILREIREDDTPYIVAWRSNPDVYRYFRSPHPLTREEHLRWFRTCYLTDDNRLDWMCLRKRTGRPSGVFGLRKITETAVEMNYLLSPDAQGYGFAAEALRALMRYAAECWTPRCLIAEIHPENTPSITLARKLGLIFIEKREGFLIYALYTG